MKREQVSREEIKQARLERRQQREQQKQRGLGGVFGFIWLIVELGVHIHTVGVKSDAQP